jgi:Nop14-like family
MGYAHVYEDLSAFPDIFQSVFFLLSTILDKCKIPSLLRCNLQEVVDFIKKKTAEHHTLSQPLQMRKKMPEPIRLLNPKYEEKYALLNSLGGCSAMSRIVGIKNCVVSKTPS